MNLYKYNFYSYVGDKVDFSFIYDKIINKKQLIKVINLVFKSNLPNRSSKMSFPENGNPIKRNNEEKQKYNRK